MLVRSSWWYVSPGFVVVILGDELISNVAEDLEPVVLGEQGALKLVVLLKKGLDVIERVPEVGELQEGRMRARGGVYLVGLTVELLQLEALPEPGLLAQPGRRDGIIEALELVVPVFDLAQRWVPLQQLASQGLDFPEPGDFVSLFLLSPYVIRIY